MLQTHHSPQVLCFIINQPLLQQLQPLPTGPFSSAYKPVQVSIKTKPSFHSTSDNRSPSISSYPNTISSSTFPLPLPPSVSNIPLKLPTNDLLIAKCNKHLPVLLLLDLCNTASDTAVYPSFLLFFQQPQCHSLSHSGSLSPNFKQVCSSCVWSLC